jgi:hypothetical protein
LSAEPPALVAVSGGGAVTAFRGLDGNVYAARYTPGAPIPWSAPAGIATPNYATPSAPALAPGAFGMDAELAFIDAATGAALHTRLSGSSWSPPTTVGGTALGHVVIATLAP